MIGHTKSNKFSIGILVLFIVSALSACDAVENIGYIAVDSSSTENDTSSDVEASSDVDTSSDIDTSSDSNVDSDSDSNVQEVLRVPFEVSTSDDFLLRVQPEDNSFGLLGAWYPFGDSFGTTKYVYWDEKNDFCLRGVVAEWDGVLDKWTHAGFGVGLCYDPAQNVVSYSVESCPYADFSDIEVVGVSFYLEGNVPDTAELVFLEPSFYVHNDTSSFLSLEPHDYLFVDAADMKAAGGVISASDVANVHFIVNNSITGPLPFDFCVRDFSLLVVQ